MAGHKPCKKLTPLRVRGFPVPKRAGAGFSHPERSRGGLELARVSFWAGILWVPPFPGCVCLALPDSSLPQATEGPLEDDSPSLDQPPLVELGRGAAMPGWPWAVTEAWPASPGCMFPGSGSHWARLTWEVGLIGRQALTSLSLDLFLAHERLWV